MVAFSQEMWSSEQLSALTHSDGKTLGDRVALTIGLCGENMVLARGLKVITTLMIVPTGVLARGLKVITTLMIVPTGVLARGLKVITTLMIVLTGVLARGLKVIMTLIIVPTGVLIIVFDFSLNMNLRSEYSSFFSYVLIKFPWLYPVTQFSVVDDFGFSSKVSTGSGVRLYGYTHPGPPSGVVAGAGTNSAPVLGKFGALVAVRSPSDQLPDLNLLKHLCLQIIGECLFIFIIYSVTRLKVTN